MPRLQEASRRQGDNFSVWLILGNCYSELGKRMEAIECYDMAGALWPESPWPPLCRGLAFLELGDDRRAHAAFDEVIRLRPDLAEPYYNRALAKYRLGDLRGATSRPDPPPEGPKPPLRAYLLRAKVRDRQGDREGARRDREAGLRGEPRDERDLTARGLARQPRDPRAALADYERALELNPRYLSALQDKANVLAEDLGRTEEAIATLDRAVTLYPDYVPARAGRGVLLARLGRREAAHADARESLAEGFDTDHRLSGRRHLRADVAPGPRRPPGSLPIAGIGPEPGIRPGPDRQDRDLDAIRDQPEFRTLVEAARSRRGGGSPGPARPPSDDGPRPQAAKGGASPS